MIDKIPQSKALKKRGNKKKYLMTLPLALILCLMVGCQDKEAMAELEEFKAQAAVEEQNKEIVTHSKWKNC